MRALLLAAGLGSRLRPITNHLPKCLVPIAGKPLLQHWLDALLAAGSERVLVNTHYLSELVVGFLAGYGEGGKVEIVHEPRLFGTGGTVAANAGFFQGEAGLVLHADNLSDLSLPGMMRAHAGRPPRCAMTMATFDTDQPGSSGIVECDDEDVVTAFHEKVPDPPGIRANAAVYIFEPEVISTCKALFAKETLDLSTEVIPLYLGRILAHHHPGYHRDIGSPASLRRANADFGAPHSPCATLYSK